MLALKTFRDKAAGVADLLNWAALMDDGIVQCKDGSLLAGWYFQGPDRHRHVNIEQAVRGGAKLRDAIHFARRARVSRCQTLKASDRAAR